MNHEKHYSLLIERARNRVIDTYTEEHHVIPRCIGGADDRDNIVRLTPEEHFLAHQLLARMNPGNYALLYAAHMMGNTRQTNKSYGWLKRKVSESMAAANPMRDARTRQRMAKTQKEKWQDPEYRKRQTKAHKGNIPGNSKVHHAPEGTAWCNKHKEYLPKDQFAKDKSRASGLFVMCKECYKKSRKR